MRSTSPPAAAPILASRAIFERVLIGVDGTKLSFDACRQMARLAEPETTFEVASVTLFPPATAAALGGDKLGDSLEHYAGSVLQAAASILGPDAELRRLDGLTADALVDEVKRTRATLLAIGAPALRRIEEIIFGGIAGELLHKAPCSMFVARPVPDEANFPANIVVGIDGSAQADRAHDVARRLATRRHSTVRLLAALGGKRVDFEEIAKRSPTVEGSSAAAVPALVEASSGADLVVVGSRGLHSPRVLGSVSERVAYQASCAVLIVR
jgi:nucleotide-binding universal stress UspA family protein